MPRLDLNSKASLLRLRDEMERLIAAGVWSESEWRRLIECARTIAPKQPDLYSFLAWRRFAWPASSQEALRLLDWGVNIEAVEPKPVEQYDKLIALISTPWEPPEKALSVPREIPRTDLSREQVAA